MVAVEIRILPMLIEMPRKARGNFYIRSSNDTINFAEYQSHRTASLTVSEQNTSDYTDLW